MRTYADTIWLVTDGCDTPVAAFTAKHECRAWLRRQLTDGIRRVVDDCSLVWPMPNGPFQGDLEYETVAEFLA